MLKKEKEKFYIIMVSTILIGVVLVWQGIFASRMAIGEKISDIMDKKAFIGAYSQREEALPMVLNNYINAKQKIDLVNERFVSGMNSIDVDKFFNELENIAADTSVSLEKVFIDNPEIVKKTVKKTSESKANELPAAEDEFLRLMIKGKYENIMSFIYKIEEMPYYIDIKSVSINSKADTGLETMNKKNDLQEELQSTVIIKVFKKQEINDKK